MQYIGCLRGCGSGPCRSSLALFERSEWRRPIGWAVVPGLRMGSQRSELVRVSFMLNPTFEKSLFKVAKGIRNFALGNGWRGGTIGHRPGSGSFYVNLCRRRDRFRVRIRVSSHRHTKGTPEGVTLEWIFKEQEQIGTRWVKDWLKQQA